MRHKGQRMQIVTTIVDVPLIIESIVKKQLQMIKGSMFAFDNAMTNRMQLEDDNMQVVQTNDNNRRSYMSPCIPSGCVSSVTI